MTIKTRMRRMGSKRKSFYRIVVADSRAPYDGRFIEEVGYYNPVSQPKELELNEEKVFAWLQKGVQPSDTVRSLLSGAGLMQELHDAKYNR